MQYKIEDGIPVPERKGRTSARREAIKSMEIDQSLVVDSKSERISVCNVMNKLFGPGSYASQRISQDPEQYRIWRIK